MGIDALAVAAPLGFLDGIAIAPERACSVHGVSNIGDVRRANIVTGIDPPLALDGIFGGCPAHSPGRLSCPL